jgi:HEAT repeat protein
MAKHKVNAYVNALDHLHPYIAARAAEALGELGDDSAVDALIGALHHNLAQVRRTAAASLGKLGDKKAIGALKALAGRDKSEDTFWAAIEALARLGDEQARGLIVDAILQGDEKTHERAVAVVAGIGDEHLLDPLRGITEDQDGHVLRAIAHAMAALNKERDS